MSQQNEFTSTPELTMMDSFPSTPESLMLHLELPESPTSEGPMPIDPELANVLRIFVDNVFEKDELSQPYLALLSESEKEELKSEISSSPALIMSAQLGTPIDTISPDWITDDILVSTDPAVGEDPTLFPSLDPSVPFDFTDSETKAAIAALLSQLQDDIDTEDMSP